MALPDTIIALAGGLKGFAQPGVALMAAPLLAYLIAEAYDAPPPWRPTRAAGRSLLLTLAFAFGFAAAMAVLVAAFASGSPLLRHLDVLQQVGALVLTLTGLSQLASFCRPGPAWARLPRPGGLWGGWFLGVACSLNWLPAMGPVLGDIVRRQASGPEGAMLLLALYVLAQVTPFLLAAALVWGLTALLARADVRGVAGGIVASAVLVLCGLLMLTGVWRSLVLDLATRAPALTGFG